MIEINYPTYPANDRRTEVLARYYVEVTNIATNAIQNGSPEQVAEGNRRLADVTRTLDNLPGERAVIRDRYFEMI